MAALAASLLPALCAFAAGTSKSGQAKPSAAALSFFESKVRPVLVEQCFSCHSAGAKELKAKLSLDSRQGLLTGGGRGAAIVAGDPERSLLIRAIGYADKDLRMPPAGRLRDSEIEAIRKWIKDGAHWPEEPARSNKAPQQSGRDFWAYQPLKARPLPPVRDRSWPRSGIDRWILAGLEARGLRPAPLADKRTLIRRATFDLTGLPPTPTEVREFVADTSPNAYEKLIDRLLGSTAYGERWGRHWLDVARYADSNGVDENLVYTESWRYRDYVVNALNADMPFDRFAQEQIAGDLLTSTGDDAADAARITATGYLSLGPKMLAEDDPVKQEMDIIDEQVDTLGKTFLGLTLGCARCHDHKFDPFPQADYYALAGIFKSTKTMLNFQNMAEWQERPLLSKEMQAQVDAVDREIAVKREARQSVVRTGADAVLAEARGKSEGYLAAARLLAQSERQSAQLRPRREGPAVPGQIELEAEEFVRGNVLRDRDSFGKGIGVLVNQGQYPNRTEHEVTVPSAGAYQLDLRYAAAESRPIRVYIDGKLAKGAAAAAITGGWFPDAQRWYAEGVYSLAAGKNTIRLERESFFPHVDKLLLTPAPDKQVTQTVDALAAEKGLSAELLVQAVEQAKQKDDLKPSDLALKLPEKPETLLSVAKREEVQRTDEEIKKLEAGKPPVPKAMAVSEGKPTDLRVHLRGNYLTQGALCGRRFPAVLAGESQPALTGDRSGRLELAQWITRPENPLTSRVIVNRVWRWHFGSGIVTSVDNFGMLGERPSNQGLLDWLAATFSGECRWSLKKLHRLIMTSSTYRMSGTFDARAARIDPENRLLWRMGRRRLEAEAIRDTILAVSGRLDRTMGGTLLKFKRREYVTSTANSDPVNYKSSRRSLYLPVIRSALYDVYTAFDFGDPTVMNGDRPTTTVAPQALFMMNSAIVLESTLAMAQDLLQSAPDDETRIRDAYERCFGRRPTKPELSTALNLLAEAEKAYEAVEPKIEMRRTRAWQSLCKSLIASGEFIYVD